MRVAFVSSEQHGSLVDLLLELHAHYNPASRVSREDVNAHFQENLVGPDSALRLMVATQDDRVVGFAAIAVLYSLVEPTKDKRKQCLLKELYVRSEDRGRGIGRALMTEIARFALDEGCCRIDWPVQASNGRGIEFYERLGAERVVERFSYRLSGANLIALARSTA